MVLSSRVILEYLRIQRYKARSLIGFKTALKPATHSPAHTCYHSITMPRLPENIDEICARVRDELSGTDFDCSDLTPLSGGNANYVFRCRLAKPLEDGTSEVLVKHGEGYASGNLTFTLPTSRCVRIQQ